MWLALLGDALATSGTFGRCCTERRDNLMIMLLLASFVPTVPTSDEAMALCKPVLARKANSEIATMDVSDSRAEHGRLTIRGRLTAYAQMGAAPAGNARANHIGRIEFSYSCEVRGHHVRKARLNLFRA